MTSSTELHDAIEELETSKQSFSRLFSLIALLDDVRSQFSSLRILNRERRRKVFWRFIFKLLCDHLLQLIVRHSSEAPWISEASLIDLEHLGRDDLDG